MGSFWCKQTIRLTDKQGSPLVTTDKPFALIGAHPKCDLQIKDAGVLNVHFYLHATEEGLFCLSLTEDDAHQGWLQPDQPIVCGNSEISASLAGTEAHPNNPSLPSLSAPHSLTSMFPLVTLHREGEELATRQLTAPLTILGRTRPSIIRIRSDTVSRVHCILYFTAGVLWIIDLHSTNRVFFQGRPHAVVALKLGEVVEIEPICLTFREITSGIGSAIEPANQPASMSAPRKKEFKSFEERDVLASVPNEVDSVPASRSIQDETLSVASPELPRDSGHDETAADAVFAHLGAGEDNSAAAVITHLQARIQELEARLRQTTSQLNAKQALIHDTADVLQASREATEEFGERVAQLEQKVAGKNSELESVQQQLRQRDEELQQLRSQQNDAHDLAHEALQTRIRELEAQVSAQAEEVTAVQQTSAEQAQELEAQTLALQTAREELQTSRTQIERTNHEQATLLEESQRDKERLETRLTELETELAQEATSHDQQQQREKEQGTKLNQLATQLAERTAEHDTLREQLAAARDTQAEAELENEALQTEISKLQTQLSQQDAIVSSDQEKAELIQARDTQLQTQEKEIAHLKSSQQELQTELQAAQETLALHTQELGDSKAANTALQQRIVSLEEDIVTHEIQTESLETQLQQRDTQIGQLQSDISASKQLHAEALTQIEVTEGKLQVTSKAIAEQEAEAEQLTAKITSLESAQTDTQNQTRTLADELRVRDTQVGDLESQLANAKQRNQTLQKDLQDSREEANHLRHIQDKSLANSEELQRKIAHLETATREQANRAELREQELGEQAQLITDLRTQIAAQDQQRDSLNDQLSATNQRHASLQHEHHEQQQRLTQLKEQVATLEDECLAEASNAETSDQRLRESEAARGVLEQRLSEIQTAHQGTIEKLQLASDEVTRLTETREATETTLATLQEQLQRIESDTAARTQQNDLHHRQQIEQRDARILDLQEQLACSQRERETTTKQQDNRGKQLRPENRETTVPKQLADIQQMVATANQGVMPAVDPATSPAKVPLSTRSPAADVRVTRSQMQKIEDETQEVRAFAQKRKRGFLPMLYRLSMGTLWLIALGAGGTMAFFIIRAMLAATSGE